MRLPVITAGITLLLAALGRADDDCDSKDAPFADSQVAGQTFPSGPDNTVFCQSKWSAGETIVGIEAWSAKFQVKAIRFKFSQTGWGPTLGTVDKFANQAHQVKEWGATDEVGIRLWGNKPDDGDPMDGIGKIIITMGGQDIFTVGADEKKIQKTETVINSASGIILGVKGRAGQWVHTLEFKMLKSKIKEVQLVEIKFPATLDDWNKKKQGMTTATLKESWFGNPNSVGGPNMTYSFGNEAAAEKSKTVTSTTTTTWAVGVSLSWSSGLEIPFFEGSSISAKYELTGKVDFSHSSSNSNELSEKTSDKLTWTLGSPGASSFLLPQKAVHCEAWAITGTYESDYTGKIKATLNDGSTFTYNDNGHFKSVGYSSASASCKEQNLSDVPKDVPLEIPEVVSNTTNAATKRAVGFRA